MQSSRQQHRRDDARWQVSIIVCSEHRMSIRSLYTHQQYFHCGYSCCGILSAAVSLRCAAWWYCVNIVGRETERRGCVWLTLVVSMVMIARHILVLSINDELLFIHYTRLMRRGVPCRDGYEYC
jgi:hypothetical protein